VGLDAGAVDHQRSVAVLKDVDGREVEVDRHPFRDAVLEATQVSVIGGDLLLELGTVGERAGSARAGRR